MTRTKSVSQIIGHLCGAAVAGSIAISLIFGLVGSLFTTPQQPLVLLVFMPLFGTPFAIIYAIAVGVPFQFFFEALRFRKWWQFSLAGLLISAPVSFLMLNPSEPSKDWQFSVLPLLIGGVSSYFYWGLRTYR